MQERAIPTVSVIMPAYNAEKYLREAIDSILGQTFTDFEFIIINDGSTDSTKDIILGYDDPRIIYLENEHNAGICVTLNKGLDAARGRYIARMDSDDISMPERFSKQVEYMDSHPETGVLGTDIEVFGEGIDPYVFTQSYESDLCSAGLLFNSCFAHPTVFMRTELLRMNSLCYEDEYRGLEDLRLWWHIAKVSNLVNLPSPLLRYRMHKSQETKNPKPEKILQSNRFRAERFELFGIDLDSERKTILNSYCYGYYSEFGISELYIFFDVLSEVIHSGEYPIKTTKRALKTVASKAIVYTIAQSDKLQKNRIKLLTAAFKRGLIPFTWYLKYLRAFVI